MKTIALLLSALLITVNVIGQPNQNFDNSKYDHYNSNKEKLEPNLMEYNLALPFEEPIIINRDVLDLWRIDSIVYFSFPEDLDSISWGRGIYTYDNINNTIDRTFQRLNDSSEWENYNRNLVTFNDKNQQTQLIYYSWNRYQEKWTNDRKYDYIHDDDDNLLEYTSYDWEQDQWVGNIKFVDVFNSNGDETLQTNYTWNIASQIWLKTSKYEHYYNTQGLRYLNIGYTTDLETGNLKLLYKDSISFNNLDLETARYFYYWNDSLLNWDNFDRDIFTYDGDIRSSYNDYWQDNEWKHWYKSEGYRIDSIKHGYNGYNYIGDSVWFHNKKSELIIDEFGNTVLYESYRKPEGYTNWLGESKQYKIFNEIGQNTGSFYYDWDYWNAVWVNSLNYNFGYNDNGINDYFCEYVWDVNVWVKNSSWVSYFSNISSINESDFTNIPIQVYPNPCTNQITLDFENLDNSTAVYNIYSIEGKLVDEGILLASNTINVNTLGEGYYMIKLVVGSKCYSGKFLKL